MKTSGLATGRIAADVETYLAYNMRKTTAASPCARPHHRCFTASSSLRVRHFDAPPAIRNSESGDR